MYSFKDWCNSCMLNMLAVGNWLLVGIRELFLVHFLCIYTHSRCVI